jgi:peptidoglycan/LPS O-acetylase OafA/YrhL
MAAVVLFSLLFVYRVPFYKKLISTQEHGRHEMLDGLRGFLAFGVFFQHAVTHYFYFRNGFWEITDVRFYRHLGGESVILFFIITSFLYWSKAIAKKGEVDVGQLYRSRLLRLAPMYLFSAGVVSLFALVITQFNIVSFRGIVYDLISWLTLGLKTAVSFNGYSIIPINAGIHWTLHFEWIFYLVLPLAALVLKNNVMKIMMVPIYLYILIAPDRGYWIIFLFGIAAAHIVHHYPVMKWLKKPAASFIPIIGFLLIYFTQYKPYSVLQYGIAMCIFLCFVYGNDMFGLLRTSVAKFLSTISYSIYLMHGIVLYCVLHTANFFTPIHLLSPMFFWYLILLSGLLTVVVASITYRYIEHPFLSRIKPKKVETASSEISERVM